VRIRSENIIALWYLPDASRRSVANGDDQSRLGISFAMRYAWIVSGETDDDAIVVNCSQTKNEGRDRINIQSSGDVQRGEIMQRRSSLTMAMAAFALAVSGAFAQSPSPQGRGAAAAAQAPAARSRPPLLFKEEWKLPPHEGAANDENRRVTPAVVTNPRLELKLYGPDSKAVAAWEHEGRVDLWTGMATSPVAVTLRDRSNYIDLTGLARLRWIVRTSSLHSLHPVVKLADGTLLVGDRGVSTEGDFIQTEVAFSGMRWFRLDPVKVVTTSEVRNPDLSRVDEIGFADLAPGGGHGQAGWTNLSAVELYANPVAR
jgi:hypothetical protein